MAFWGPAWVFFPESIIVSRKEDYIIQVMVSLSRACYCYLLLYLDWLDYFSKLYIPRQCEASDATP